jgi:hypothetical protein
VAQPVQGDRRQPGVRDQAAEQPCQPVRPDRLPRHRGEHVPGLGPSPSSGGSLGLLPHVVGTQRRDRRLVERDDPPPGIAPGRPGHQPPAELLQLPGHRERPGVEVKVAPPQAGGLAAAQPAQRHQMEQRIQPMTPHPGQEPGGLPGGPHPDHRPPPLSLPPLGQGRSPDLRTGPGRRGQFRPPAGIGADEPGTHGPVQRGPQRGMDPPQRRRAHRAAQRRVTADDRGEHRLDIGGRQLRQRDTAQVRDQVAPDMRGIPAAGRGAQRYPRCQPPLQPLPRPQPSHRARSRAGDRLQRRGRRRLARKPAAANPPPVPRRRRQLHAEIPRAVPPRPQFRAARPEQPAGRLVPAAAPPEHRTVIHVSPQAPVGSRWSHHAHT